MDCVTVLKGLMYAHMYEYIFWKMYIFWKEWM